MREMPHTLAACSSGVLKEHRGGLIEAATEFLSTVQRAAIDEAIAGSPAGLGAMGDKDLDSAVKAMAHEFDRGAFLKRLARAETERCVILRPAPDGMTWMSALLPLKHGVDAVKSLTALADAAREAGDTRNNGQLMARSGPFHRLHARPRLARAANGHEHGRSGAGVAAQALCPSGVRGVDGHGLQGTVVPGHHEALPARPGPDLRHTLVRCSHQGV